MVFYYFNKKDFNMKTITIPSVTIINRDLVAPYKEAEEINLPNTEIEIGFGAFQDCDKLKRD
jgi:hypothetical protein